MTKPKLPMSDEEAQDQYFRREERRYTWTHRGRGTQFQASIAKLSQPMHEPAILRQILAMAWTPHYAAVLQQLVDAARHDPGSDGLSRATEAAREVWNDIMGEPRNRGGRPPKYTKGSDFTTSQILEKAIADARRGDPNVTEDAALREYVRRQEKRRLSERDLTNKVRLLSDTLQRTRREFGETYDFWIKPLPGEQRQETIPK